TPRRFTKLTTAANAIGSKVRICRHLRRSELRYWRRRVPRRRGETLRRFTRKPSLSLRPALRRRVRKSATCVHEPSLMAVRPRTWDQPVNDVQVKGVRSILQAVIAGVPNSRSATAADVARLLGKTTRIAGTPEQ